MINKRKINSLIRFISNFAKDNWEPVSGISGIKAIEKTGIFEEVDKITDDKSYICLTLKDGNIYSIRYIYGDIYSAYRKTPSTYISQVFFGREECDYDECLVEEFKSAFPELFDGSIKDNDNVKLYRTDEPANMYFNCIEFDDSNEFC